MSKNNKNPSGLNHSVQNHLENGIKNIPSNGCGFSFLGIVLSAILLVSSCGFIFNPKSTNQVNPKSNLILPGETSSATNITISSCYENCSIDGESIEN